jgi:hypothetical protein
LVFGVDYMQIKILIIIDLSYFKCNYFSFILLNINDLYHFLAKCCIEQSIKNVNFDKVNYWKKLQVKPDKQLGYRSKLGEYTVKTNVKVAISKTLANSQHGDGGSWQVFIDDFTNNLTFVKEILLK